MNITKQQLVEFIIQELEEMEKVSSTDIRKSMSADAKQKTASGVTDQERGIIQKLQSQLSDAAASGNIASGKTLKLAQLLSAELSKISGG
jgi:chemotaxis signal transduction protein